MTPAEKAALTQLLNAAPVGDFDYISNRDQTLAAIQVAEQPQATTYGDLRALSTDTHALLKRLADRLPSDRLEEYRALSRVGEWAMLANELSASLVPDRSHCNVPNGMHSPLC
ncbi:hypothetical protein [Saccharopolyspora sp. NPDC002376]